MYIFFRSIFSFFWTYFKIFEFSIKFKKTLVKPLHLITAIRCGLFWDKTSLPLAEDESVQKFETCRCKLTKVTLYLQGHNMLTFSEGNYRFTTWGHHFTGRHSLTAHINSIGSTSQLEDEVSNLVVLYVEGIWFFCSKCLFYVLLWNECIHYNM